MEYITSENCIIIRQPENFRLSETLECGQCFRFEKISDEEYIVVANRKVIFLKEDKGDIVIEGISKEEFRYWKHYFDLDRDYAEIKSVLAESDGVMKEAINYAPGIRVLNQDFFECLISFIISQNNRIPMIKKVIANISEKYGDYIGEYNGIAYYAFPTPEQLGKADIEGLMSCKTGFRAKYIVDAVTKYNEGLLKREEIDLLSLADAKKRLMTIKGVGTKVADCVLFFSLERTDVFPTDVWIKRVMEYFYFEQKDTKIDEIHGLAEKKFGKNAGFAQQYLFNYARSLKIGTK